MDITKGTFLSMPDKNKFGNVKLLCITLCKNTQMAKLIRVQNEIKVDSQMIDLVQLLADDNTIEEASELIGVNKRTLEGRIIRMKAKCGVNTLYGLVALFFRNKLIK